MLRYVYIKTKEREEKKGDRKRGKKDKREEQGKRKKNGKERKKATVQFKAEPYELKSRQRNLSSLESPCSGKHTIYDTN